MSNLSEEQVHLINILKLLGADMDTIIGALLSVQNEQYAYDAWNRIVLYEETHQDMTLQDAINLILYFTPKETN